MSAMSEKPSSFAAGIADLDHAGIVLGHRHSDGLPAFPSLLQLLRIARVRQDARQLFEVQLLAIDRELALARRSTAGSSWWC